MNEAERFHLVNPIVWDRFEYICRRAVAKGVKRWSAKAVWEICRWYEIENTQGGEPFKLKNDYHAWYARHFLKQYPELDGFFELRSSQFDADPPPDPQVDLFDPSPDG